MGIGVNFLSTAEALGRGEIDAPWLGGLRPGQARFFGQGFAGVIQGFAGFKAFPNVILNLT
jgi:hypothetical protein